MTRERTSTPACRPSHLAAAQRAALAVGVFVTDPKRDGDIIPIMQSQKERKLDLSIRCPLCPRKRTSTRRTCPLCAAGSTGHCADCSAPIRYPAAHSLRAYAALLAILCQAELTLRQPGTANRIVRCPVQGGSHADRHPVSYGCFRSACS